MAHRNSELSLLSSYSTNNEASQAHELRTTPLLSYKVYDKAPRGTFPQTGLLGSIIEVVGNSSATEQNERLYFNTNAPLSGVVCGVQGSGKSHTVSTILESCFLPDSRLGELRKPLAGVVGGSTVAPCEAAFVSTMADGMAPAVPVTVLVSPLNLQTMRRVYSRLPHVSVLPLHLSKEDVTADRLLALMSCDAGERRPLYIDVMLGMMRDTGGDRFNFEGFRREVERFKWLPAQKIALAQRFKLIESYMRGGTPQNCVKAHFGPGKLVIIDLTDPMVDAATSSGMFDIVLGLFMEKDIGEGGKIVVLDEAHKYLTNDDSSARLTASVLSLIRQQRHLAVRTIISTQEPTVIAPTILDLVSFICIHRFTSPSWAKHLDKHLNFASTGSKDSESWFELAVQLRTGEAFIFSPSATVMKVAGGEDVSPSPLRFFRGMRLFERRISNRLGSGYIKTKIRRRLTCDGGSSLMAVSGWGIDSNAAAVSNTFEVDSSGASITATEDGGPFETLTVGLSPVYAEQSSTSPGMSAQMSQRPTSPNPNSPAPQTPGIEATTAIPERVTQRLEMLAPVVPRVVPLVLEGAAVASSTDTHPTPILGTPASVIEVPIPIANAAIANIDSTGTVAHPGASGEAAATVVARSIAPPAASGASTVPVTQSSSNTSNPSDSDVVDFRPLLCILENFRCQGVANPTWQQFGKRFRVEFLYDTSALQSLGMSPNEAGSSVYLESFFQKAKSLHLLDYTKLRRVKDSTVWLTASQDLMATAMPLVPQAAVKMTETEQVFLPLVRQIYHLQRLRTTNKIRWLEVESQLEQLREALLSRDSSEGETQWTDKMVFSLGQKADILLAVAGKSKTVSLKQRGFALARTVP